MPTPRRLVDPQYLRSEQYRDDHNLLARIQLHQRFSTNRDNWFRWLFDHFDVPDGVHILDLGCGRGDLWWDNRDRLPSSWHITLADFSAGMLGAARQRLASELPNVDFRVADAEVLSFADGTFNVVVANHMLYHVQNRSRALQGIRRVLCPGGQLYAATNGRGHMRELDALIRMYAPSVGLENPHIGFSLDNGEQQLRPWFTKISRHDYPDALEVTEVEPLVAYVLSTSANDVLDPGQLDALRNAVAQQIASGGAFQVSKEVGMFSCRRS
jgi:ubiquinone/menaquinone biosynthesis C-methylase UbiE